MEDEVHMRVLGVLQLLREMTCQITEGSVMSTAYASIGHG